jgi:hypothetical protein
MELVTDLWRKLPEIGAETKHRSGAYPNMEIPMFQSIISSWPASAVLTLL